ncbi:MAG: hypothetical protein LBP59_09355 [Planctomycetaceae bacterium]|nr:hypothetical protein [Planctomycetaceae bacterium]
MNGYEIFCDELNMTCVLSLKNSVKMAVINWHECCENVFVLFVFEIQRYKA